MTTTTIEHLNIDQDTLRKTGLRLSEKPIQAQLPPNSRVFEYPGLEDVYVMESDLYGNPMPEDSCFLAFQGHRGLIGKHLKIETLRNSSVEDIKRMVQHHIEG
jgi:hypothetical protein